MGARPPAGRSTRRQVRRMLTLATAYGSVSTVGWRRQAGMALRRRLSSSLSWPTARRRMVVSPSGPSIMAYSLPISPRCAGRSALSGVRRGLDPGPVRGRADHGGHHDVWRCIADAGLWPGRSNILQELNGKWNCKRGPSLQAGRGRVAVNPLFFLQPLLHIIDARCFPACHPGAGASTSPYL